MMINVSKGLNILTKAGSNRPTSNPHKTPAEGNERRRKSTRYFLGIFLCICSSSILRGDFLNREQTRQIVSRQVPAGDWISPRAFG